MAVLVLRHVGEPRAFQQGIGTHLLVQIRQVRAGQHLVRHDHVEDRLALAGMEIERA